MRYFYTLFVLLLLFSSCDENSKGKIDISHIQVDLKVNRFDQEFFKSDSTTISSVIRKYPYLFPGNEPDTTWLRRKNDSLAQALFQDSQKVFIDFGEQKKSLEQLFKHVKFYYPTFKTPEIITLINNLDFENQVIYADTLLLISLDTYLGEKSVFYANYPDYLKRNYDKKMLPVHVAKEIAKETLPKIPYRVFLDRIISSGKLQYAVGEFLPEVSQAEIFAYTDKQLQWAEANEENIWKYFIEKEYLYSTDKELKVRFLDPAPFSKFYLVTDSESPGQIGAWLGYRIVQSYMKNYDVSLPELMATAPTEIFKKSKYKPNR
jgi:gliding motility-associated lipoprotein GldB